jgi:Domain of unknown function (DUF4440)
MTADTATLAQLNERFIEAFRQGSWELLQPILADSFQYLDGTTGQVWPMEKYIDNLRGHAAPELAIDQVTIHVDGDTAVVSARSRRGTGRSSRYLDTYKRTGDGWLCVHACVWPIHPAGESVA